MSRRNRPFRVALTGAPCWGKTSALKGLPALLRRRGYKCVCVPETASHLLSSGAFERDSAADFERLQSAVLRHQLFCEELVLDAADGADIVLCDRGALDGAAFVEPAVWRRILRRCGVTRGELLDRYDAVFLMQLPEARFYTTDNNIARIETYHRAVQQQELLDWAWNPHPRLVLVEARDRVEERLVDVAQTLVAMLRAKSKAAVAGGSNIKAERDL